VVIACTIAHGAVLKAVYNSVVETRFENFLITINTHARTVERGAFISHTAWRTLGSYAIDPQRNTLYWSFEDYDAQQHYATTALYVVSTNSLTPARSLQLDNFTQTFSLELPSTNLLVLSYMDTTLQLRRVDSLTGKIDHIASMPKAGGECSAFDPTHKIFYYSGGQVGQLVAVDVQARTSKTVAIACPRVLSDMHYDVKNDTIYVITREVSPWEGPVGVRQLNLASSHCNPVFPHLVWTDGLQLFATAFNADTKEVALVFETVVVLINLATQRYSNHSLPAPYRPELVGAIAFAS